MRIWSSSTRHAACVCFWCVCSCHLLLCARTTAATIYTTDHTFNPGDYDFSVEMHQTAHAMVLGGWIENALYLLNQSTADLYGGNVNALYLQDTNVANVHSGAYINTYVEVRGPSVLNLSGGRLPDRWLEATDQSIVNFYVRDYQLTAAGGQWGFGRVTGTWLDNQPFVVNLQLAETAAHLRFFETPEPCSAGLLVCGSLALIVVSKVVARSSA